MSLCLTNWAPLHEDVLGSRRMAPLLITSALDGGGWILSRPGRFNPGEKFPIIHSFGVWMGPRASLDPEE
jgi:hypothetical protein